MCSSFGTCFTCRVGFYGQNCSALCPSECADRVCNQSGTCLQCKEGYYRQADICLPCPRGCVTCDNSTHCSSCHETHDGPFQAKCIRRCSEKTTNFVSYFNERCGIPLDKISQNQFSCFAVNLKQGYECKTLRYCISCHPEDCNRTKIESHKCLCDERCRTECNPVSNSHIIKDVDETRRQTLCEEKCSLYHAVNGKKGQTCPSITEGQISSIEDVNCFQDREPALEDSSMPIAVFILVLTIVISVLMIVTVVYLYRRWPYSDKNRCTTKIGLTREVDDGLSTPRCMTSHDNVTPTIYLTPTSERVYDKPN